MAAGAILRPARVKQNDAPHIARSGRAIQFLHPHPAYDYPHNVLLSMYAFDSVDDGLHHDTAKIACALIAGNRWDGYFAHSPEGPPISQSEHLLLKGDRYYFVVPGTEIRLFRSSC